MKPLLHCHRAIGLTFACLLGGLLSGGNCLAESRLEFEMQSGTGMMKIEAVADEPAGFWLLQHSTDFSSWRDLAFLENPGPGRPLPGIELPTRALPQPAATRGFFRAIHSVQDQPRLRELLANQIAWRLRTFEDYQFEISYTSGMFFWRGIISVVDNQVVLRETILPGPFDSNGDGIPSIDGLMDQLAAALKRVPTGYNVTWNAPGYPGTASVDPSGEIADEEFGWTIHSVTPVTDPRVAELLVQQGKWRQFGIHSYQYGILQTGGDASWQGTIRVVEDLVVSRETISASPPSITGDNLTTIDALFAFLKSQLAGNPFSYQVTWDATYGFPKVISIDRNVLLADDEIYRRIDSFTPLP